ncbi:MAG: uracil-DNA glycosylase [Dehalococcoidia bacterium]|nr:uracil-DNA glycosylase [Dehalococcoidia bacterium]MDD5493332.1 uracil-DNA glycosylase [Dehalococcoidia bacterium]
MSALVELNAEIERCRNCELAKHRTKVVPGEGPENARLLFIGEAPGWYEDQSGRPFVGPAGQYLDQLIGMIGLKRSQVFIANVIKCRPPDNRDPLPGEIQSCGKWLESQLELIRPKVVVTLGRYSMAKYFPGESISKIHGRARRVNNIIYFAMYHPAAALHQGNLRKVIEADMLKLPGVLAEADAATEEKDKPAQLTMF